MSVLRRSLVLPVNFASRIRSYLETSMVMVWQISGWD
jgi:hypothetical protein